MGYNHKLVSEALTADKEGRVDGPCFAIMDMRDKLRSAVRGLNFVSRDKHGSKVTPIPLRENGDFGVEWPGGFFDERYQDTVALLRLKATRDKKR